MGDVQTQGAKDDGAQPFDPKELKDGGLPREDQTEPVQFPRRAQRDLGIAWT